MLWGRLGGRGSFVGFEHGLYGTNSDFEVSNLPQRVVGRDGACVSHGHDEIALGPEQASPKGSQFV